ncbi:VOC family protein [Streptomyces iconiensis]|uniref:VOC family protein n=1 Tax=Streptomyces iconiensis TaxID=1384038 RepID=A0ABT6ZNU7_9ACTN|nr:VOC family protein [Streptomyces iconiensis]MDJ1130728.1 VOC family protein [Streptomyces iconiensis]
MTSVSGIPCWVSLTTRDMRSTEEFYGAVLGWSFRDSPLGDEYRVATEDGEPVAGLGELAVTWQLPVRWTVFFQVEDADITTTRIAERGATVAVGPLAVGSGRAVLAADPSGAPFGLWQGEQPRGWAVGTGHAPAWLELRTRDAFDAALFYGAVFGWAEDPRHGISYEEQSDEVIVLVDGKTVAGLRDGGIEAAPDPRVRPRWEVFFRAPDLDGAVSAAIGAGGEVVLPPQDTEHGRAATLRDPDGALFSLLSI